MSENVKEKVKKIVADHLGVDEDKVTEETSQKDALKNAPEKDSDYFKVPTVLKK